MPKNLRKFQNQNDGKVQNCNPIPNVDSQFYQISNACKQNGECVLCKRNAVCVCQRCGDFYCSPECQRKDWQAHRYICFPMPNLIRPSSNVPNPNSNVDNNMPTLAMSLNAENTEKQQQKSNYNSNVSPPQQAGRKAFQHNSHPSSNVCMQYPYTSSNSENAERQHQQQQKQKFNSNVSPPQQGGRKPVPQNKVTATHNNQQTCLLPAMAAIPQNNSCVLLSGFRSSNRCCVRSLAHSDIDGFMVNAKTIDTYGKTAPPLSKVPEPNTYAICKLDSTGVMHRVQILYVKDGSARVLFLDIGVTALRKLSELREISDSVVRLKQYTIQVQLKDVEHYEMTTQLKTFLSQFEDKEFKFQLCKDYSARGCNVVLRHWQTDESLNEQIVNFASKMSVCYMSDNSRKQEGSLKSIESGVSKSADVKISRNQMNNKENPQEERNTDCLNNKKFESVENIEKKGTSSSITPVMVAPFDTKTLKENMENIKVVVVDNTCLELGSFGCIAQADIKNFSDIYEYLARFDGSGNGYTPRLNEYCIAKFEGEWFRAKVIAIPSKNESTVLYVDYTNESTIKNTEIRPYPKDFKYPCTTTLCLIDGLPDIDEKLRKALETYIPLNAVIKIDKVQRYEEPIAVVELTWLIEKLRNDKLI